MKQTVTVKLDTETVQELRRRCAAQGRRPVASLVREIIDRELKAEKEKGGELCGL